MASVSICEIRGRNIRVPQGHLTFHIPHPTSNIPHSQHSSPKSTRFFPSRPDLRPNTPFLAHLCNRLTISPLPFDASQTTFLTRPSPPRNATFRPTKHALRHLHPLPFASRYLTSRNPKDAQRPAPPSAHRLSTRPISPPPPSNRAFPPSISPKIPTPHFHQISLPSALSPTAKMILWNVKSWAASSP